ncbi:MAG: phosphomannomutase/phosphoglucomutase [Phycisphaerales bacterium]|nr:MAG: phosphomannomutase/phosphoglucomutase [Phycisphaerales bacterium]
MDPAIFKAYDIRGVYPDQINEEDAWKIGSATAQFLRSQSEGNRQRGTTAPSLCVGRDMRTHSESIAEALIEGMNAAGTDVIDIGMIDTPQMYFAINHLGACGGVQVTASHNPARYNGFKVSGPQAKPIGGDTGLKDIEGIAITLERTKGSSTGSAEKRDLTAEYKDHVLQFLRPMTKKMKVAIDASNGMAGKMIPAIFGDLAIEIIALNLEHTGTFNHEPNPLVEENLAELKAAVKENKCDFGVCFDGDADRLMMVDQDGNTIGCDLMTALMTPYFLKKEPGATILYDLRSSRVVAEEIIKHGGTPHRERVGHAFMKKTMRDVHALFGGELSGHFYYRDNFCADSGMMTLVHVLNILSEASSPVGELIQPLQRYSQSGEMNFEVQDKQARMQELAERYSDGQIDHLDGVTIAYEDWWLNCRPSNTEPLLRLNVEAATRPSLEQKLSELKTCLGEPV